MLRASARSMGSNHRRLWEVSIIKSLTGSSLSSSPCDLGGGSEFLPSREFCSRGSPAYNEKFSDWKLPRAQACEPKTLSVQLRNIMDDQEDLGRMAFKSSRSSSSFSSDLVYKGLMTSSVTSLVEGSSSIPQRRASLISCNLDDIPSRWSMMGASFPSVCPSHRWSLGQAVRLATSKAGADPEGKSSEEAVGGKGKDDKSAPRSIEDFQHEEVVGPTVERDLSDTADEVRASLTELRTYMASFGTGFLILGSVQLITAILGSFMSKSTILLWRDVPYVLMAYTFAYLLWNAGSAMGFFTVMEGRSRLRILTLSLQVIKALSQFFYRSGVLVRIVAFTTLLAMLKQTVPYA